MYDYEFIFDIYIENDAMKEEVSAAKKRVEMLQNVWNMLMKWWQNAINAQTKYYNWKHKFKFFNVNDLVMLSAKNLKQKKLNKKLSNKMIKFFHIQEFIDKQMYHLDLSIIYRFYFYFYFFIKCMQPMAMALSRRCMYAKLHVTWPKSLLYIFSLVNHIDSLRIQALSLKPSSSYSRFPLSLRTLRVLLFRF